VFVVADSTTDFFAGFLGGLIAVLLFGRRHPGSPAGDELAQMAQVRSQQLAEMDVANLKSLATSLEEFAVDHNGSYPAELSDLVPTYAHSGTFFVPGSNPPVQYVYEHPAADPAWGQYDLKDDGSFDPTLYTLRNVQSQRLCTRQTCAHIMYLQNAGLVGGP
jgi:hypothetical protein